MMKTGICSIALRRYCPEDLVELVVKAGLEAIEWGGDVHVLPGDVKTASHIRKMTESAGLEVASYGSYWKGVDERGMPVDFEPVLASAEGLGADAIRIWAGNLPSDAIGQKARDTLISSMHLALDMAYKLGIKLSLEFHANTLADSNFTTFDLLNEMNHPNLFTNWQPIYWLSDPKYRLEGLENLANRVLNMHVFHWMFRPGAGSWDESIDRRSLAEGAKDWRAYLGVPLRPEIPHYALLEFVRGDDPDQVFKDAVVLNALVGENLSDTARRCG